MRKDLVYSALIIFGTVMLVARRAYARAVVASSKRSPFKGFGLSLRSTHVLVILMAAVFIVGGTFKLLGL